MSKDAEAVAECGLHQPAKETESQNASAQVAGASVKANLGGRSGITDLLSLFGCMAGCTFNVAPSTNEGPASRALRRMRCGRATRRRERGRCEQRSCRS